MRIPDPISQKVSHINVNEIVVGKASNFNAKDLSNGILKHLGIILTPTGLQFPNKVIPPSTQGRYSLWNVYGREIIRKDLPKETKYRIMEAPNWGDSYNGTHEVSIPYEGYRREYYPAKELEIEISCSRNEPGLNMYQISFRVNEVLDKNNSSFSNKLLENLNLLQENIGACSVEPSTTSMEDYLSSLRLSWEIFPPGSRNEAVARIFFGKTPSTNEKKVAFERYDFFQQLKPKSLLVGTNGFRRYFGALLEDNLTVFENIEYGNAVYILFGNWKVLSQRSRTEILSGRFGTDFVRIVHAKNWKNEVKRVVSKKRVECRRKINNL